MDSVNVKKIKIFILYAFKMSGLFYVTRLLTKRGLRILCYHGFSEDDELLWNGKLFISKKTFRARMNFLEKHKFNVIGLDSAIDMLCLNKIPKNSVVITIDDGWKSTKYIAHDIIKKKLFPYTIYMTTYYSKNQFPVFNIIIQYFFWKTKNKFIDTSELGLPFSAVIDKSDSLFNVTVRRVIDYALNEFTSSGRNDFIEKLRILLNIDISQEDIYKRFHLLSADEIRFLVKDGVDFQLHTHRHHWPSSKKMAFRELDDNKLYLEPIVGKQLEHFCFPSGRWDIGQLDWLDSYGIKSSTTCDSGFNYSNTPNNSLKRFLDSEMITRIEFEAEMFGFLQCLRSVRQGISKISVKLSAWRVDLFDEN